MSRVPLLSRDGDVVSWALNITQRIERDYAELKLRSDSTDSNMLSMSFGIKADISSVSDVIETRLNSLSAQAVMRMPRAWARFDGTTPPYTPVGVNVASVTRSGAGAYWLYITEELLKDTVAVSGNCAGGILSVADESITSVKVLTLDFAGNQVDSSYVSVIILGLM